MKASKAKADAEAHEHPIEITTNPTVAEIYACNLRDLKERKKPYAKQKWAPIERLWGAITPDEITVHTFNKFIATRVEKRTKKKCSAHTIHKDIILIRQILRYAMDHGRMDRMPHIPKLDAMEKNPRPSFTKSEWRHLMVISQKRILEAPFNSGQSTASGDNLCCQ